MGKYEAITKDVLKLFATPSWLAHGIPSYPGDYIQCAKDTKFIRVDIVLAGPGLNRTSVSGQIIVDIFVPAGFGPSLAAQIADKLDKVFLGCSHPIAGGSLQVTGSSSLAKRGKDSGNPALFRYVYAVSCNFFGV